MSSSYTWVMDVLQTIGMVILAVFGYYMKKEMADAKLITDLQSEATKFRQELALLKQQQNQAPTHNDLSRMYNKINSVSDTTKKIEGQMQGISDNLRLVLHRLTETHKND